MGTDFLVGWRVMFDGWVKNCRYREGVEISPKLQRGCTVFFKWEKCMKNIKDGQKMLKYVRNSYNRNG